MPNYLCHLLKVYRPARDLRSNSDILLEVPFIRTDSGARSFTALAPKLWNKIPRDIRASPTLSIFCTRLKNYLLNCQC